MNIAIVGSRDYQHLERVRSFVRTLPPNTVVVSGGARGVDTVAEETAKEVGLKTAILRPDWGRFGKVAGFMRNESIVLNSDRVVAFWDGKSKGTRNTISLAQKSGKTLTIILDDEDE